MNISETNITSTAIEEESTVPNEHHEYPSVTFESVTFSDGTTVKLDAYDVVVLVGPNNAGKSVALRELEEHVRGHGQKLVVNSAQVRRKGSQAGFRNFLDKHAEILQEQRNQTARGYKFHFGVQGKIESVWPDQSNLYYQMFCVRILTEERIKDSNPVPTISTLDEPPSHPIHMLYDDPEIELRISEYFRKAFGKDLILYRTGGSQVPLLVGERIVPETDETVFSKSFRQKLLDSTVRLADQGDGMRSFASVILHLLTPATPSILLLDEPEAFLHPPQARLLGEIIATERSSRAQLIIATHSPDVLHGLIAVAPDNLRVIRIRRDGEVNRIKELDKKLVKEISLNPLMRYSSVMSGVFHKRVVVCEGDADCMFYSSVLSLPDVGGNQQPDVLFVHAGGISRMASLAKTMVALDVPVDVVADIDVLRRERENDTLKPIVESLGGDWNSIQQLAQSVRQVIEQTKPEKVAEEVKNDIEGILNDVQSTGAFQAAARSKIEGILRDASPWGAVKRAGRAVIPHGQPTQQFDKLLELCKSMGLWIVPVGELESFCSTIGRHGPRWAQQVIEERNLAEDDELREARDFVSKLWHSREA